MTPHATTGYSPHNLLFGVHPRLPVDALLGHETGRDRKDDWLEMHRRRLDEAHARAREYAEQKSAERLELDKPKVYCPPVDAGQLVYLRNRPKAKNKIQDSWGPVIHKVLEVQGTT